MTITSTLAFAAAFFLLALSPGPGLVAILSRTLGTGFQSGLMVTMGLVMGDAVFLGIAMIGLSKIATTMGPLFQGVKYLGAAYLIWLGIQAFRAASVEHHIESKLSSGPWQDIGLGLMVTMGNPKPILFYGALLPTFLDLSKIGMADFGILMSIVLSVSIVVYSGYMLLAERARRFLSSKRAIKRLNQTTGVMLIGSGLVVASRS
jgi:threonine/homoserine/homoserine lactone efflux protein